MGTNDEDFDETAGLLRPESDAPVGEVDDLEQRLLALSDDVRRVNAAEMQKRREQTVLEARAYVSDVRPIETNVTEPIDAPKILLKRGLDPRQDPTLVGRRNAHDEWEFGDDVGGDEPQTRSSQPDALASDVDRGGNGPAQLGKRKRMASMAVGFLVVAGVATAAHRGAAFAPASRISAERFDLADRVEDACALVIIHVSAVVQSSESVAAPSEVIEPAPLGAPPVEAPVRRASPYRPLRSVSPTALPPAISTLKGSRPTPIGKGPRY